jgi:hypothetical protein
MNGKTLIAIFGALIIWSCILHPATAREPIKWSAPSQSYPNRWTPSQPPPEYNDNPYAYSNPYAGYYAQGAQWAGQQAQSGNGQGNRQSNGSPIYTGYPPNHYPGGYSGNPYAGYYGGHYGR